MIYYFLITPENPLMYPNLLSFKLMIYFSLIIITYINIDDLVIYVDVEMCALYTDYIFIYINILKYKYIYSINLMLFVCIYV